MREPALESRERPGEALDLVGDHAMAEARVGIEVSVRVDEELVALGREARDHVLDHGLAAKRLQPLVDAPHAAALAAGEDDARDLSHSSRARRNTPRGRLSRAAAAP